MRSVCGQRDSARSVLCSVFTQADDKCEVYVSMYVCVYVCLLMHACIHTYIHERADHHDRLRRRV